MKVTFCSLNLRGKKVLKPVVSTVYLNNPDEKHVWGPLIAFCGPSNLFATKVNSQVAKY